MAIGYTDQFGLSQEFELWDPPFPYNIDTLVRILHANKVLSNEEVLNIAAVSYLYVVE